MQRRVFALVGAGNMRCAPAVIASLCTWYPDFEWDLKLFEASEERLDLIDRLAQRCFEDHRNEATITATSVLDDLAGCTDAIVCLNEDGSRRMIGRQMSDRVAVTQSSIETGDRFSGDPNRPTPYEQLSDQTRLMLEVPVAQEISREEAIHQAAALVWEHLEGSCGRSISLLRESRLPSAWPHEILAWPPAISQEQLPAIPHQILRWLLDGRGLLEYVNEHRTSPLRSWLNGA